MHELGIAASVIDVVRAELAFRRGYRAAAVSVRIGALAGVDPESLRFGFEVLVKDTDLDPLELEIQSTAGEDLDVATITLEETA